MQEALSVLIECGRSLFLDEQCHQHYTDMTRQASRVSPRLSCLIPAKRRIRVPHELEVIVREVVIELVEGREELSNLAKHSIRYPRDQRLVSNEARTMCARDFFIRNEHCGLVSLSTQVRLLVGRIPCRHRGHL